jgi:hypothetical protein
LVVDTRRFLGGDFFLRDNEWVEDCGRLLDLDEKTFERFGGWSKVGPWFIWVGSGEISL